MSQLAARVSAEVMEAAARLIHAAELYGLRDPNDLLRRAGQLADDRGWTALQAIAHVRAELDAWWQEVSAK